MLVRKLDATNISYNIATSLYKDLLLFLSFYTTLAQILIDFSFLLGYYFGGCGVRCNSLLPYLCPHCPILASCFKHHLNTD